MKAPGGVVKGREAYLHGGRCDATPKRGLDQQFEVTSTDETGTIRRKETTSGEADRPNATLEVFLGITMESAKTDFE